MCTVFIPARGESKSIPFKNIKSFAGRPLIYWVLDAAVHVPKVKKVVVSTDSDNIKEVVQRYDHPKVSCIGRAPHTATDEASTESAIEDFIKTEGVKGVIILMQATSPLTTAGDLIEAINQFEQVKADTLVSVVRQKRFYWKQKTGEKHIVEPINYDPRNRPLRQNFNGFLVENGAFYIFSAEGVVKNKSRLYGDVTYYEMSEESYFEIDEATDWTIMEGLLRQKHHVKRLHRKDIKLFITDVDGVLTDAGMYYAESGDELKKFNTRDGMGLELLRKHGVKTAIITSEETRIVERRAKKLKVDYVVQNCRTKLKACQEICEELGITLQNVAFVGDDINDLDLLREAGFAACPADAVDEVKMTDDILISNCKGGEGVVRDVVKTILEETDISI